MTVSEFEEKIKEFLLRTLNITPPIVEGGSLDGIYVQKSESFFEGLSGGEMKTLYYKLVWHQQPESEKKKSFEMMCELPKMASSIYAHGNKLSGFTSEEEGLLDELFSLFN